MNRTAFFLIATALAIVILTAINVMERGQPQTNAVQTAAPINGLTGSTVNDAVKASASADKK